MRYLPKSDYAFDAVSAINLLTFSVAVDTPSTALFKPKIKK